MSRLGNNPLMNATANTTENETFDPVKARAEIGIDAPAPRRKGRPVSPDLIKEGKSTQIGLTEDWTRATFIMRVETLEKLKDYAYTERLKMKDALDFILSEFLNNQTNLLPHDGGDK